MPIKLCDDAEELKFADSRLGRSLRCDSDRLLDVNRAAHGIAAPEVAPRIPHELGSTGAGSTERAYANESLMPAPARDAFPRPAELRRQFHNAFRLSAASPVAWRCASVASGLCNAGQVTRLATYLRAYAGQQSLCAEAVELLPFLCSLAHVLRRTLDIRIDVVVKVLTDCPNCSSDPRALEDAMVNLVVNARDAMPEGGTLTLSARGGSTPGESDRSVAISVCDTGIGMTQEIALRAQHPFFTTKSNAGLAGMGLPAVEGFARQSGGRLEMCSAFGCGTNAILHLPRAAGAL